MILLRMSRMLLMHRVLNKELNKDVIDLQRKMYQENYQITGGASREIHLAILEKYSLGKSDCVF